DYSPRTSPSLLSRGDNLKPISPVELTQTRSSPPGSNSQSPNQSVFEINDESDEEKYQPLEEESRTNNNLENYERIIIQESTHNTENNFSETSNSSVSEVEININSPQDYKQEVFDNYLDQIEFKAENNNSEPEPEPELKSLQEIMATV
ncbi:16080_t:CDS:1, partial [Dentiscutata erythropus]